MPHHPPVACDPSLLASIIEASRVTCADVDAYWADRSSEGAPEAPLGLSLTQHVGRTLLSGACGVGPEELDPGRQRRDQIWVELKERRYSEGTREAWDAARAAVQTPNGPKPSVPAPMRPEEMLPDDMAVDLRALRVRNTRDVVCAQASMLTARLAQDSRRWRLAFISLTYADVELWAAYQITRCLDAMKKWAKRRGFKLSYVWVAELGEANGRLHYHICVWLPKGNTMPKPDKRGWWPHGFTTIEWARNQRTATSYLAKYMTKGAVGDASFPPGCRIRGAGGLTVCERLRVAWGRCPAYVRERWPDWADEPRRQLGGGWVSRVTGEWIAAAFGWVGFLTDGRCVIRRLNPVGVALPVGAWMPEDML